jgi:hypothetical protein
VITKALSIVAVSLCVAAGAASPQASADPNYYGVLSCSSCEEGPHVGFAYTNQVNAGIRDGLTELPGIPD